MRIQMKPSLFAALAMMPLGTAVAADAAKDAPRPFTLHIQSQSFFQTIVAIQAQTHLRVWFALRTQPGDTLAPALSGTFTPGTLMDALVAGTPFSYRVQAEGFEIYRPAVRRSDERPARSMTEVQVRGSRVSDIDIAHTPNDPQPYVVVEGFDLENSAATDLSNLLRDRLPFNTTSVTTDPAADVLGTASQINLRGAGPGQTLILIDGHRVAANYLGGEFLQTDLRTLLPAQVERVEVLPASASSVYGGGATGGVVNVILKRDFQGIRVGADIERFTTARPDSRRVFLAGAESIADGRLRVGLTASYAEQAAVLQGDRPFALAAREHFAASGPGGGAPLGATTNVAAVDGNLFGIGTPSSTHVSPGDGGADLAGGFNLALADSAQANGGAKAGIRSESKVDSAAAWGRLETSPSLIAELDVASSHSTRELRVSGAEYSSLRNIPVPDLPTNPVHKLVLVTPPIPAADGLLASTVDAHRATLGLVWWISSRWQLRMSHAWSYSALVLDRPIYQLDPFLISSGVIDVFAAGVPDFGGFGVRATLHVSPMRTVINETSAHMAGPVFELPTGPARLTMHLEHRRERFVAGGARESLVTEGGGSSVVQGLMPEQGQRVDGVYVEVAIPVLPPAAWGEKDPRLQVQLGARGDRYSARSAAARIDASTAFGAVSYSRSTFTSTNWSAAVRWQPSPLVLFRASYGTGFLAPTPTQLASPTIRTLPAGLFADPVRGSELTREIELKAGGNPDLDPERSRTYSAGFVLAPSGTTRLSVDAVYVERQAAVFSPADGLFNNLPQFLSDFSDSIVRAPRAPGDAHDVGPISSIDATSRNLLRSQTMAVDVAFDQSWPMDEFGTARFSLAGTYEPRFAIQTNKGSGLQNHAGIGWDSPLLYELTGGLSLETRLWLAGVNATYLPHYIVSDDKAVQHVQGSKYVSDQTYCDVFARRRFELAREDPLVLDLQAGVTNVLGQPPPPDANAQAFSFLSPVGASKARTYYLSLRMQF